MQGEHGKGGSTSVTAMTDINSNQRLTRSEVAQYFRQFADQFDPDTTGESYQGDAGISGVSTAEQNDAQRSGTDDRPEQTAVENRVTFLVGTDSATVNPPREVGFQIDVGTEGGLVSASDERHVTFEVNWNAEDVTDEETLDIE